MSIKLEKAWLTTVKTMKLIVPHIQHNLLLLWQKIKTVSL